MACITMAIKKLANNCQTWRSEAEGAIGPEVCGWTSTPDGRSFEFYQFHNAQEQDDHFLVLLDLINSSRLPTPALLDLANS